VSDDDGQRRPAGRPAPRFGEYASPETDAGSTGLSEADARIVAQAAEYRRAQAERDAPATPAGRGGKKAAKAAAPQTLAEQMAEERRITRERQQAEKREAQKAAVRSAWRREDARRQAERTAAADRRTARRGPVSAPTPGLDAPASPDESARPAVPAGAAPARPAYLAGQGARRAPWRFDAAITIGLLAAGLVNVVGSIQANADPAQAIDQSFSVFGAGAYTTTPQTAVIGIAVNVVNIVVFVLTAWISLELVKRKRVAFWVPIAGALLAGLVTTVLVLSLILADPAFQQFMASRTG
jgi:hypothetical protein